jgi:hypothetical protein
VVIYNKKSESEEYFRFTLSFMAGIGSLFITTGHIGYILVEGCRKMSWTVSKTVFL